MMTCVQARSLLGEGAQPGTPRKGNPELGFHLALCGGCRAIWNGHQQVRALAGDIEPSPTVQGVTDNSWKAAGQALLGQSQSLGQSSENPEVVPPTTHVVTYRSLLRNPNFRWLWLGEAISTFGSYFTRIALPIYVFSLTSSYTQLGLAAFSSLVASLFFGLIAGALVDRWNPRRTMIAADVANGLLVLVLLALVTFPLTLPIKLAAIYLINFAAALVREMFNPARVAILADVVEESELLAANSLDQATTTFAELASYPLAAFALVFLGTSGAFLIDAVTFFVSALLLLHVRTQYIAREVKGDASILSDIVEGLNAVRQLPLVRKIVMLSLIMPLLISLFNTLQLPYVIEALGSTEDIGFPVLEGVMVFGIASGVLALGRWGQHVPRAALLWYGILLNGLALILQGLVPVLGQYANLSSPIPNSGPWTTLLFLALPFVWLTGAANSLIFASIRTVLQEQTPREVLGRVVSVYGTAAGLGFALGALLTGIGQGRVSTVLTLIGVAFVGIGLVCRSSLTAGGITTGQKYYSLSSQR